MEGSGPARQLTPPLTCQIEASSRDLDWTLVHFTFVAEATTLADDCDLVCSPAMSVASYHGQRFPALAFLGESPEMLGTYATFLVDPGSEVHVLVDAEQLAVVEQAFTVLEIKPLWQMVFRGAPALLDPGPAVPLTPKNLPAMRVLAKKTENSTMGEELFEHGPAVGIWEGHTLAAMGVTRTRLAAVAEIGKIATHPDYRGRGYTASVIAALVQSLLAEDTALTVFAMVLQNQADFIRLYEELDFERARPMYLVRCLVGEAGSEE